MRLFWNNTGKKFAFVVFVVVIGLAIALFWPSPAYDYEKVHPSLQDLSAPYRSVLTSYFQDGGSIGMIIIDRDGRRLELALPRSPKDGPKYPQLFLGITHISKPGGQEIPSDDDTRNMLISIIEKHHNSRDGSGQALVALRGQPRDYLRRLLP